MARVKIDLPDRFAFRTEFVVSIGQINAGNHMGNDALVALLNETFLRFMEHKGFPDLIVDGLVVINADLALINRAEVFRGDRLEVEGAAMDFTEFGFDFVCRVMRKATAEETALAKIGMLFFDLNSRKIGPVPAPFRRAF
jgi:4-hydroxybenzoyl-CoA thioesterase